MVHAYWLLGDMAKANAVGDGGVGIAGEKDPKRGKRLGPFSGREGECAKHTGRMLRNRVWLHRGITTAARHRTAAVQDQGDRSVSAGYHRGLASPPQTFADAGRGDRSAWTIAP